MNKEKEPKNDQQANRLTEQEAPYKNTDKAFVKVGRDGEPQFPADRQSDEKARSGKENEPEKKSS